MNERSLARFLTNLVLLTVPFPTVLISASCGGTASVDNAASGASGAGGAAASCSRTQVTEPCGSVSTVSVPPVCVDPSRQGSAGNAGAPPSTPEVWYFDASHCSAICGTGASCEVTASTDQAVSISCYLQCGVAGSGGRRPAGLQWSEPGGATGPGGYFAELARLEAASVAAFRTLRDELHLQGAPKKLVRAAGRAARDEVRHARATAALARRFGAEPRCARVEARAPKSLEAMAIENAAEGCVRETFGALLATWQARAAGDPVVRAAMMRIARDETRHAALSWRVARWLDTRLDPEARLRVEVAKRQAVRQVLDSANGASASFADVAGLPSAQVTAQLAHEMQRALWS